MDNEATRSKGPTPMDTCITETFTPGTPDYNVAAQNPDLYCHAFYHPGKHLIVWFSDEDQQKEFHEVSRKLQDLAADHRDA